MQFIDFQNRLSNYPIFSLKDVLKMFYGFSYRQLDRWEKKGYLKKLKRGFYCFSNQNVDRDFLFYTANKIYPPSYVSLETALKYYGLIPEEIFHITSVSTKKTANFDAQNYNFSYRHIKPKLYFGYKLIDFGGQKLLLADPEKAILDYLYIHKNLKTADDFLEMRINPDEFKEKINMERLQKYLKLFGSLQLAKRVKLFLSQNYAVS